MKKNEISFKGESKTVLSGYRTLVETISKFGLNKLDNKPKDHIELYKRERVIEYMSKRLEEQNILPYDCNVNHGEIFFIPYCMRCV